MTWYSPLVALMIGTLLVIVSAFLSRLRRLILAIIGLALILPGYALMTPLGANLLVLTIERRIGDAEAIGACHRAQVAVLLAGGLERPAETTRDFNALTTESLSRTFVWRDLDATHASRRLPLIIAGGGPFRIPEAGVIAELLHTLDPGHPPLRIETGSKDTWESARAVRELLPDSTIRIVLASGAMHLPRATYAFEQAGFEVCPLALNRHYIAAAGWSSLVPQSSSLVKSESALHELLGEAKYRVLGAGQEAGGT